MTKTSFMLFLLAGSMLSAGPYLSAKTQLSMMSGNSSKLCFKVFAKNDNHINSESFYPSEKDNYNVPKMLYADANKSILIAQKMDKDQAISLNRQEKQLLRGLNVLLQEEHISPRNLERIVDRNKSAAQAILDKLDNLGKSKSYSQAGISSIRNLLEEGLALGLHSNNCSPNVIELLLTGSKKQNNIEDKIYYLEKAQKLCPQTAGKVYQAMGDAYLNNNQYGLAVKSYRKALNLERNSDLEELLKFAKEKLLEYKASAPISISSVEKVFSGGLMAPVPARIIRDVQIQKTLQTRNILFKTASAKIQDSYRSEIDVIGEYLTKPGNRLDVDNRACLIIEGHADRRGSDEMNIRLSRQRAESVKEYLVSKFKIDPDKIIVKGYGYHRPVVPNDNSENMKLNRRVEFKPGDLE